jgi:hypothetical protein
MRKVANQIGMLSNSGSTVLITSESEVISAQNSGYVYERVAAGLLCVFDGTEFKC